MGEREHWIRRGEYEREKVRKVKVCVRGRQKESGWVVGSVTVC